MKWLSTVKECSTEAGFERTFRLRRTTKPRQSRTELSLFWIHSCLVGTKSYSTGSQGSYYITMLMY